MASEEPRPAEGPEAAPAAEAGARPARRGAGSLLEGPIEIVRAVLLGLRDTAGDIAENARTEARAAYEERWSRFDELTKGRRARRERHGRERHGRD